MRDVSVKIFKGQAASFVIDTKTGKRTYVGQREDLRLWEEMKQSQNRGYRIDERRLVVNHRPILWIAFIALGVLTFLSSGIKSTTGCGLDNLPRYSGDHNVCYDLAADLRGVVLTGATLNDRSFRRAFLPEVKLSGANLEHSDFTAAYLGDADLSSTRMKHATLSNAVMWEAKLPGADLREAVFDGADLRGANLAGARLQGANLSSADLRGADLTGAVVCGAKLPGRDRYSFTARDKIFGIEFVDGPAPKMMISAPKGPRPVGGQKGYLRGHDAAEYPKWERAYTQVQEALLELTNRPTPTALRAMGAALGRIDVSNGQSTQRAQMLAIESLQAAASGRTVAGALAHDDLQDFLEEVEKKARDHCISTHGALAAPNIPSPVWAYNLQRLRRLVIDHLYPL